jgi:hypothetical protein
LGETSANGDRVGDLPDVGFGDLDRLILGLGDFADLGDLTLFRGDLLKLLLGLDKTFELSKSDRIGLQLSPSKSSPAELELDEIWLKLFPNVDLRPALDF